MKDAHAVFTPHRPLVTRCTGGLKDTEVVCVCVFVSFACVCCIFNYGIQKPIMIDLPCAVTHRAARFTGNIL